MEGLRTLREISINNQLHDVVVEGDLISLGGQSFPRSTQTPWKGKSRVAADGYTLESLVHFVKNISLGHAEYMRQPRAQGVGYVAYLDRKVGWPRSGQLHSASY